MEFVLQLDCAGLVMNRLVELQTNTQVIKKYTAAFDVD